MRGGSPIKTPMLLALAAMALVSCSEAPQPTSVRVSAGPEAILPPCRTGCGQTDSNPNAPGVWLGSAVTPTLCGPSNPNGISDADQDSLSDFCETQLSYTFAPQLAYYSGDCDMGRETHWAARPLGYTEGAYAVRIAYLMSYYVDCGSQSPSTCWSFPYNLSYDWCYGHAGDSEDIYLDVYYDVDTQHWVLQTAYYSHHGAYATYASGDALYPTALYYPGHPGWYPQAQVSVGKHANYASQQECDAAQWGFEVCLPDSYVIVTTGQTLNIGSRHTQLLNCMASSNPFYSGDGRSECYWTGTSFAGWQTFEPDTDPYSPKLANFGF